MAFVPVVVALVLTACSGEKPAVPVSGAASVSPTSSAATPSPTTSSPAPDLARFYSQKLRWRGCGDGFQCARVIMPMDYGNPSGRTITLSVNRLRANSGSPKASLLVNPGGPGVSGTDLARNASSFLSKSVRSRFDVVGFDPRGVGKSTPIDCWNDKETDAFIALDGSPDTAAEEQLLAKVSRQFGQRCAQRSGELLAHVGTRDAARDLDVLRGVLGDERLHYLGYSYGTYLGAMYAQLFPDRVGALVLDGAIDPATSTRDFALAQALGFELALRAFVDDCRRRSSCPLPRGRQAALDEVQRILMLADRRPLAGDGKRRVTQGIAVLGVAVALYDKGTWPLLRNALRDAQDRDGGTLLVLVDSYTEREENGRYLNNSNDALYAVNCIDRPEEGGVEEARRTAVEFARQAPVFGAYLAWGNLPCATWPHRSEEGPGEIRAAGAAPILVVGTVRDPATPYAWAKALAHQLESGRLLTWDGDGHTAYGRGISCIDDAVDAYLLEGELPPEGTRC